VRRGVDLEGVMLCFAMLCYGEMDELIVCLFGREGA